MARKMLIGFITSLLFCVLAETAHTYELVHPKAFLEIEPFASAVGEGGLGDQFQENATRVLTDEGYSFIKLESGAVGGVTLLDIWM